MSNPYCDQNGVYFNKFGLTDGKQLSAVEYALVSLKAREIFNKNIFADEPYSLETQRKIHEYLFVDVYDFAGKFRNVPYSKKMPKSGFVSVFASPQNIETFWGYIEKLVAEFVTHCDELEPNEKLVNLVNIFAKANYVHPFPEGNGRALQIMTKYLGQKVGIDIDFSKVSSQEEWAEACGLSSIHGPIIYLDGQAYLEEIKPDFKMILKIFDEICQPMGSLN